MKALALTLALAIISVLSFAQFPQSESPDSCCFISNDLRASIFMDENSIVNVKIAKIPGELIKIRVKENDKVLYQKRVKSYAIADIKFNVNQFPKGNYVVEIVKDKEVVYSRNIEKGITEEYLAKNN